MRSIYQFSQLVLVAAALMLVNGCEKKKPQPAAAKPAAPTAPAEAPKPKEPAVELKVKWELGKRYLVREETSIESAVKLPNQPEPTKSGNTISRELALTILNVKPEGGMEIEVEFVANKVESKLGDRVVSSFNSADDPKTDRTNALAKLNRKVVGGKITFITDAEGNVEKVEGVSNLVRKVTLGLDKNSATLVKAQFSEDALKKMGLMSDGMPKQAVSPGDSWTNTFDMPVAGGAIAKFTVQSTLKGYEERKSRRSAIIKSTGTAQTTPGAASGPTIENVKVDGEAVFDVEKNQITTVNATMSLDSKMTLNGQSTLVPLNIKTAKTLLSVSDAPKKEPAETPAAK